MHEQARYSSSDPFAGNCVFRAGDVCSQLERHRELHPVPGNDCLTLIGAIAVVISLVYLSIQVRAGNELQAAQARYNLRVQRSDIASTIQEPFTMQALYKYASGEKTTPAEQGAVRISALRVLEIWEWQHGEYAAGMLKLDQLPVGAWKLWFSGKGEVPVPLQEVWEYRKAVLRPDFVDFMTDNVVDQASKNAG